MADGGVASGYRAFLSYSHKDAAWGAKLHRRLESYKLPKRLAGTETARGIVPVRLSPIFRDREELSAGENLSDTIKAALAASENLIVMCSPDAKASPWVAKEIALFRELHPDRPILAALVSGEPSEAFPEALTKILPGTGRETTRRVVEGQVPEEEAPSERTPDVPLHPSPSANGPPPPVGEVLEPIAADFRKSGDGERLALLKLVAGMTGVPLDALVQRDAQRQMRRVTAITSAALAAVLVMALLTTFAFRAQREAERQRAEAEGLVEYMLTDLRDRLKGVGRLDVMDAVNERAMGYYSKQGDLSGLPDESLLRRARVLHAMGEDDEARGDFDMARAKFGEAHRATATVLTKSPSSPDAVFSHAQSEYWLGSIESKRRNVADAERRFKRYLGLALSLEKIEASAVRPKMEIAYAYSNIGQLSLAEGQSKSLTLSYFERSLETFIEIKRRFPDIDVDKNISNIYAWISDTHYASKNFAQALVARERQRAVILESLSRDFDNNGVKFDLAVCLRAIALSNQKLGNVQGFKDTMHEALEVSENLIRVEPNNDVWEKHHQKILRDFRRN